MQEFNVENQNLFGHKRRLKYVEREIQEWK